MSVATDLAAATGTKRKLRLRVEGVEYDFWQDDGSGLPTPRRHPVGDDCIALWRFDETSASDNAADATGHGHTATQTSSPAVVAGKFSNAREFAAGDCLTVADSDAFHVAQFTVAFWCYYDGTYGGAGTWQRAVFYDWTTGSTADAALQIMVRNAAVSYLHSSIHVAGGYVNAEMSTSLPSGVHHVATTYDGATLRLYLDGAAVATTAATGAVTFGPASLSIGNDLNFPGGVENWRGWIDDLAFYSTAKSPEWIARVAANGSYDRDGINCLLPPEEVSTEFDLGEMKCGLSALTFELLDVKDSSGLSVLSPLFGAPARWDNNPHYRVSVGTTYLQQVEANAVNIPVVWTDATAAAGTIYIGRERIDYQNVATSNTFTGCNRGMYPALSEQLGHVIPRPQESDGETIPSVGTVPFSRVGARVALHVLTYDNRSAAWNDPSGALLLWTGRLSHSVRYVPARGCWQLTAVSITDELDRKICENLVASAPGEDGDHAVGMANVEGMGWPGLVNLLGLTADERSLTVTEEGETFGGALGGHYVTVPAGVYTLAQLQVELRAATNWTSFGSPEISFEFAIKAAGTAVKCWAYSITTWDARSVWITSGRGGKTDAQNSPVPTDSHLTNALGFGINGRWSGIVREHAWISGQRFGDVDSPKKPCMWYQPATAGHMALMHHRTDRFITAQETGLGAFVVCDALRDRDGKTVGMYIANYTAESDEIASVSVAGLSYTMTYDQWTLSPVPGVSYPRDHWAGWRCDEDPVQLRQAYVPFYNRTASATRGPYEMLLNSLVSTGTPGVNGVYDILPTGWGLGIESSVVDTASFITADAQVMQNDLAHRPCYVIDKPVSWSELCSREAKLFGFAVVWNNGRLTCKNTLTPAVDAWTVELSDSTRAVWNEKPTLDIPSSTVVNRYAVKMLDRITRKDLPLVTITDVDSREGIGETRAIEISHPGIPTDRNPEALAGMLKTLLVGGRGSMLRYPSPVVEVSLAPSLVRRVYAGDVIRYSSSFTPDVQGTGTMGTTCFALVTRIGWSYKTWTGSAQLVLLTTTSGYGDPWAPSALVNTGAAHDGWDAAAYQLYLSPLHFGQSGDDDDGVRFAAGQFVVVVDSCPSSVNTIAYEGPYEVVEYVNAGKYLQLASGATISSYNAAREWVVEACNWGTTVAAQRLVGTWHANATTLRFSNGNSAQRWGK